MSSFTSLIHVEKAAFDCQCSECPEHPSHRVQRIWTERVVSENCQARQGDEGRCQDFVFITIL